ncbi:hypothetical protein L3Q82_018808 [Scortum barcoo]|uniref:Uncharacterized protein n=1 Tax=Scortum barcoo TaxID=214431 RepID=A0ACB8VF65_9TELE|nr:hypothetical protein L3Q82_018808 [Scortum barcoo]
MAVPQVKGLEVDIMEGEITVLWKPVNASSDVTYNVEMANYNEDEWAMVTSCTGIKMNHCDISSLIHNYVSRYKIRVQVVVGDDVSAWISKRFFANTGKLQPPSFSLSATSSTITVYVHQKPILEKLFPYGVTYTIFLEDRERDYETTAYLKDDMGENQKTKIFKNLHWGTVYCVKLKVESNAALPTSSVSPPQCILLPAEGKKNIITRMHRVLIKSSTVQREWFITAVSSLTILGVLTIIGLLAVFLQCYLKRPEKTPAALKSPVSGWHPLSVGEGEMEVVTDKGWFLFRSEEKNCVKNPLTIVTVMEDNEEEEDRRTSMDSGVGMESNSVTTSEGTPSMTQEDSGCGSLGGSESSTSSQTDYPLEKERTDADIARKREDSGVGLGCHLDSSSLDGQDSGSLKEAVSVDNYRSQCASTVQIDVCDDEELFQQILPNSVLAEVVTGYRAAPQLCICSGEGQCMWCHKQGHPGTEVIKQYKSMCIDNGLLSGKCEFVDSYKRGLTFPSYSKKTQMDSVIMDNLETTFIQLGETFPLLTALTPLALLEGGQDFNMNNVPLSLCDVHLTTD